MGNDGQRVTQTAGLVLLWPFYEVLFDHAGLTTGAGFASSGAQAQAVRLMHRLAVGKTQGEDAGDDTPERDLTLEKLLCAWPDTLPLPRATPMAPDQIALADALLSSIGSHWAALGKTSVEGLQESFLARPGALSKTGGAPSLVVAASPVDPLLDALPWQIAAIHLPWMPAPLAVTWRERSL